MTKSRFDRPRTDAPGLGFRRSLALGLLAGLLIATEPAPGWGQRQEPLRTTPELPFGAEPFGVPRPSPRRVRPKIIYSLAADRFDALTRFDPALTRLCRRGAFTQVMDGWLYARTPQRRYGVAFPNGANLYDPQQRRQADQVYFFREQDTGRCRVYAAPKTALAPYWVAGR